MKFSSTIKVTGMKFSKGKMDNGTEFDSTKVYVETELDTSKDTAMGTACAEYGLGKADEYQKYKHLADALPFMAIADMEIVTNGKTQKTVIHSLKPIEPVKAAVSGGKNVAA
ncbi:hypothetical protein JAB5_12590 [Janthinobacterium sp. HH103]|uniref:hypothetical protein n=1 Tax=unclassified Janthinobacterium TaxID=2610881 RepID=UPI000873D832|nr:MULTISPECIES: hypothetical protein [unclassified Janthinobacterium]OEZ65259.1 hypothetical protein JAB2_36570 [Janthinobacterium sp. HH100]OEZ84459.1 hypothetical protein JAB5_12590 [Janthinobacterium sp. HH103]QOU71056.1 hypothetical protein JAB4_004510 [Janthinobacterium sp. HH102]